MFKVITSPERYNQHLEDANTIFLAGGITGCPDWQMEVIENLSSEDVVLFNPRRPDFDVNDKTAASAQIMWEYEHLRKAHLILFWFPKEQIQPIALFELGAWSKEPDNFILVGCHPEYPRRFDVVTQLSLTRLDVNVYCSLNSLMTRVKQSLVPTVDSPFYDSIYRSS